MQTPILFLFYLPRALAAHISQIECLKLRESAFGTELMGEHWAPTCEAGLFHPLLLCEKLRALLSDDREYTWLLVFLWRLACSVRLGSRNDFTNGQGATLPHALRTRPRCVNRAAGPSALEEGILRLDSWGGVFFKKIFPTTEAVSQNSPPLLFWFPEAAHCIRDPSLQRGKGLFSRTYSPQGAGGRAGPELRSLSCASGCFPLPSTAEPAPAPPPPVRRSGLAHVGRSPGQPVPSPGSRVWAHMETTCWGPSSQGLVGIINHGMIRSRVLTDFYL